MADGELLPFGIDLQSYREALREEASRLVALPGRTIPWYLRQQALLFLAAFAPSSAPIVRTGSGSEMRHYRELIRFLRGESDWLDSTEFSILAILARRAFVDRQRAIELTRSSLNTLRERQIARRDPSFFMELTNTDELLFDDLPANLLGDLSRVARSPTGESETLEKIVLRDHPNSCLRNELSLLRFGNAFLKEWRQQEHPLRAIMPVQVHLKLVDRNGIADVEEVRILASRGAPLVFLYEPPRWCAETEQWRFHLGYLLRFILSGHLDFTRPIRPLHWKENESVYRQAESHWYQRLYGLFSGQQAFGDDWLPITDWMERFLLSLLRWPGCRVSEGFESIEHGLDGVITQITKRIKELEKYLGKATGTLMLPMILERPTTMQDTRTLRACVVQTVIPGGDDFKKPDLALDDPTIRKRHRNHLSAALAAVDRMLVLRETHTGNGHLDWLILPELAVHPSDVRTHLVPFARAHRAMILTGLTYERLLVGQPLVNSALWIIPEWSNAYGLQVRICRQGKANLAPDEQVFNGGVPRLQGFRPCQWLVGYPWSDEPSAKPVWLTAAVCYDATDLGLAADLRGLSDVFAIPALNKDVKTFDQMALALHYHMFQLVIVANNGQYGGSNAYWPRDSEHVRQIFHTHGQPQALIAFLDIDDISTFLERHDRTASWKYPPAGL